MVSLFDWTEKDLEELRDILQEAEEVLDWEEKDPERFREEVEDTLEILEERPEELREDE